MSITQEIADKLAQDVIKVAEALDDERIIDEIAQVIGASSPSTEEAFRTACRVRMAETRARRVLAQRLRKAQAEGKVPPPAGSGAAKPAAVAAPGAVAAPAKPAQD